MSCQANHVTPNCFNRCFYDNCGLAVIRKSRETMSRILLVCSPWRTKEDRLLAGPLRCELGSLLEFSPVCRTARGGGLGRS